MKYLFVLVNVLKKIVYRFRGELPTEAYLKRGMKIGKNFHRLDNCSFDISHCWLISIGNNVTCAPGVKMIAHDASTNIPLGYVKIGRIVVGNNVFIGAGTIILCNVNIGNDVVIGAGSVVTKDIPSGSIAVGSPAKVIGSYDAFIAKNKELMKEKTLYGVEYTIRGGVDKLRKEKQIRDLIDNKIAYIK